MAFDAKTFHDTLKRLRQNKPGGCMFFDKDITNADVIKLADALQGNTSLTNLDLGNNQIGDVGATALADTLKHNTTLESASFDANLIGDDGAIALAEALNGNPTLDTLRLGRNRIGDGGAKALADLLRHNNTITHLNLSGNQIGDAGLAALADALGQNSTLKSISLGGNRFTEAGTTALAAALRQNKTLISLYLPYNEIGFEVNRTMEAAIIGGNHKNLISAGGLNQKAKEHCINNRKIAERLVDKIQEDFTALEPAEWIEMAERLPAIHWLGTFSNRGVNSKEKRENVERCVAEFKTFLDTLPTADPGQPTALAALTARQGEFAPIDNPRTWLEFPNVLSGLNQNGLYLQAAELLDENHQPNALFNQIIERGEATALFTKENWTDASKEQLQAVLRAAPEGVKEQLPNLHQLMAATTNRHHAAERG